MSVSLSSRPRRPGSKSPGTHGPVATFALQVFPPRQGSSTGPSSISSYSSHGAAPSSESSISFLSSSNLPSSLSTTSSLSTPTTLTSSFSADATISSAIFVPADGQVYTSSHAAQSSSAIPTMSNNQNITVTPSQRAAVIAGSVIGGFLFALLIACLWFFYRRYKSRKREYFSSFEPKPRSMLLASEDLDDDQRYTPSPRMHRYTDFALTHGRSSSTVNEVISDNIKNGGSFRSHRGNIFIDSSSSSREGRSAGESGTHMRQMSTPLATGSITLPQASHSHHQSNGVPISRSAISLPLIQPKLDFSRSSSSLSDANPSPKNWLERSPRKFDTYPVEQNTRLLPPP